MIGTGGRRLLRAAVLAAVSGLLSVALAVATEAATDLLPQSWTWTGDPVARWGIVGVLTVATAAAAAWVVTASGGPGRTPSGEEPPPPAPSPVVNAERTGHPYQGEANLNGTRSEPDRVAR